MLVRSVFVGLASVCLLVGCAAGEPLDDAPQALELGDPTQTVEGLVYIDVTDDAGSPLLAEVVWVSSDAQDPVAARCFELGSLEPCPTWFADFEADAEVNVYAELCGETFMGTLWVDEMPAADGLNAAHITVVADIEPCGTATPVPKPARK